MKSLAVQTLYIHLYFWYLRGGLQDERQSEKQVVVTLENENAA
jgi:hypothetical protein